jgi:hypothetical protein
MRQRPFGLAGDRHKLFVRVRAPQRLLGCIADCIAWGCSLIALLRAFEAEVPHHCAPSLPFRADVVLHLLN